MLVGHGEMGARAATRQTEGKNTQNLQRGEDNVLLVSLMEREGGGLAEGNWDTDIKNQGLYYSWAWWCTQIMPV